MVESATGKYNPVDQSGGDAHRNTTGQLSHVMTPDGAMGVDHVANPAKSGWYLKWLSPGCVGNRAKQSFIKDGVHDVLVVNPALWKPGNCGLICNRKLRHNL